MGQAGFTVFVVVLFNMLVPEGWRTGLVRVQDIAIGAGIASRSVRCSGPGVHAVSLGARSPTCCAAGSAHRRCPRRLRSAAAPATSGGGRRREPTPGLAPVAALEDLALEPAGHVDREGGAGLLIEALMIELAAAGIVRARSDAGERRDAATPSHVGHRQRAPPS